MHHSADNTPEVMNAIESALDKIRAALAYTGLTYRGAPNIPDGPISGPTASPESSSTFRSKSRSNCPPATTTTTTRRSDALMVASEIQRRRTA